MNTNPPKQTTTRDRKVWLAVGLAVLTILLAYAVSQDDAFGAAAVGMATGLLLATLIFELQRPAATPTTRDLELLEAEA
jgi:dipeptide/tripeptide permease